MVFKKPFAFIIRHFKAFHIVMFITSLFIFYSSSQIRKLVKSLISANTYMYAGAKNYTSSPIYVITIIGLIAVGFVYWLFKARKKDLRYYRIVVIYYVSTIFTYFYLFSKLNYMAESEVTLDTLNMMRDLTMMNYALSIVVLVVSFIRSLGLNIKQYNFSKDIEELQITDKDSEEFEVLIGQNNYKYVRKFRKMLRETRYAFVENIVYITLIGGVILFAGAATLGVTIYQNNHSYAETQVTTVNGVYVVVNNTYITAKDLNGNTVKEGYKFVIVNISLKNTNTYQSATVDTKLFSLQTGRLVYKPVKYYQEQFLDLGKNIEEGAIIPTDSFITGNVVFEIPDTMNVSRFNFRVFSNITSTDEEVIANYVKFAAVGENLDSTNREINLTKGQRINTNIVDDSLFNIVINDASIQDKYNEKYFVCKTKESCTSNSQVIKPSSTASSTMIILSYTGALDADATYYVSMDTMEKFLDHFVYIDYSIGNKSYEVEADILYNDVNGKAFIEIRREIAKANSVNVVFKFRNETYIVSVK